MEEETFGSVLGSQTQVFRNDINMAGNHILNLSDGLNDNDGASVSQAKKSAPYDISGFTVSKPNASEVLVRLVLPRAISLPTNCGSSIAKALTGATTTATFQIAKNGTNVASFIFASGGQGGAQSATFSNQTSISFAAGDSLTITAPAVADATLSDVGFTIVSALV